MHRILRQFCTIVILLVGLVVAASARAASPPATPENINVLVVIIDFLDAPRPDDLRYKDGVDHFLPLTVANVEDVFFNNTTSTAERYLEMSNGLMTIVGDVIEVSVPLNIATAEFDDWRLAANAEASSQGYLTTNYDRVAYLLAYGYKDQIRTGGAIGTYAWATGINAGNTILMEYIYNHELGHTIDLEHAQLANSLGVIVLEGDSTDPMGLGDGVHVGAVNKYYKGWLDGVRNADHPIDSSVVYDIYPLANSAADLQAVVVDTHGASTILDKPVDTFVSYRKPVNFDDNLSLVATDAGGTALRNTVHIHEAAKTGSKESVFVEALAIGETFNSCGLAITVNSMNPNRVRVQIDQTTYAPTAPGAVVVPQSATAVEAGNTVFYDLDVTNFDAIAGACEAFYDESLALPDPSWIAGWVSAGQTIAVEAGQTTRFENFSVHAPVGTLPGVYQASLTLTNNGGVGAPVSTIAQFPYEVLASLDTSAPSAPANLSANEIVGTAVVLSWDASADDVGVHTYHVFHNSSLLPDGGNNLLYADLPPPSGGYTPGATNGYVVAAVDAAGNVSPLSNWAFAGDDLLPPSTPTALGAVAVGETIELDWLDSTDDVGVTDYDVHRDGMFLATTTSSEWVDAVPDPGVMHVYTTFAWDGFGNLSGESDAAYATVASTSPPAVPALGVTGLVVLSASMIAAAHFTRRKLELSQRDEAD